MMTKQIEYDPERAEAVRDKWIHLALGGDTSVDLEAVKAALPILYKGHTLPEVVVVDSPLAAQRVAKESGLATVQASAHDALWEPLRASVAGSVGEPTRDLVWGSVGQPYLDSVWESVGARVRKTVRSPPRVIGGADSGEWVAYYSYYVEDGVYDEGLLEKFKAYCGFVQNVWSAIALDGLLIVSRRPEIFEEDSTVRFTVQFKDGFFVLG